MFFGYSKQQKFPISNFNDKKVTLDQELGEKTVAFRDKTLFERQYLINRHKFLYFFRKHLPFIYVALVFYEIFIVVMLLIFTQEFLFWFIILPPIFLISSLKRETKFYKDIGRPVVKTVGTLKTLSKKNKSSEFFYFKVESVEFNKNNNDYTIIEKVIKVFGKNQSVSPIRIEYSPYSKTVWKIKKWRMDYKKWEVVYNRLIYPYNVKKELSH